MKDKPKVTIKSYLDKKHIWMSEILCIIFTVITFAVAMFLVSLIVKNEAKVREYNIRVTQVKSDSIAIASALEELESRMKIIETIKEFTKGSLPDSTLRLLSDIVYTNSERYGYDPLLLLAVINVESVFEPRALGRYRDGRLSGALGLMQLKFGTAREMAEKIGIELESKSDLFIPEVNIPLGVAYLTKQISRFENIKLGILSYNQGPYTITRTLEKNQRLSIRYYNKVLDSYYKLKQL
ncbi:MAG: lytic transglycosylase domain-containing protein [Chitinivibrionales bacterium]